MLAASLCSICHVHPYEALTMRVDVAIEMLAAYGGLMEAQQGKRSEAQTTGETPVPQKSRIGSMQELKAFLGKK